MTLLLNGAKTQRSNRKRTCRIF